MVVSTRQLYNSLGYVGLSISLCLSLCAFLSLMISLIFRGEYRSADDFLAWWRYLRSCKAATVLGIEHNGVSVPVHPTHGCIVCIRVHNRGTTSSTSTSPSTRSSMR